MVTVWKLGPEIDIRKLSDIDIGSLTAVGEEGEQLGTVLFVPLCIVIPFKPWVTSKVLTAVLCCVFLGMLQIRKIFCHFLQSRDRTWKQKWNCISCFLYGAVR